MDPKRIVEHGYDRIAERHREWAAHARAEERERYARLIGALLPEGADVLEMGCGSGLPTTKWLAERFKVAAVDLSARHVELAQANVPRARIFQADMTRLELPPASVDGVVAFYSIIHVPREEHSGLLRAIATWLRPGGVAVLALGSGDLPAHYKDDWLGAPMFWSHFDAATNRALVEQAGLTIERAAEEVADEDGMPITFLWVVARKP